MRPCVPVCECNCRLGAAATDAVVDAEGDPNQQRHRGRLRSDGQECIDLGRCAFENVGAPKMKRHGRELERQADHDHQAGKDQHHERAAVRRGAIMAGISIAASFAAIVGRWAEPRSRRAG